MGGDKSDDEPAQKHFLSNMHFSWSEMQRLEELRASKMRRDSLRRPQSWQVNDRAEICSTASGSSPQSLSASSFGHFDGLLG